MAAARSMEGVKGQRAGATDRRDRFRRRFLDPRDALAIRAGIVALSALFHMSAYARFHVPWL